MSNSVNVFILTTLNDTPLFIEKSLVQEICKIAIPGDFVESNATFRKFVDSHDAKYVWIQDIDDGFKLSGWMLPKESRDSLIELCGDKIKLKFVDDTTSMIYKAQCLTFNVSDEMLVVENIGSLYSYLHDQKFIYSKEDRTMYQEFSSKKHIEEMLARCEKYLTKVKPTKYEIVRD